jgi:transglutaminase superfamily protein
MSRSRAFLLVVLLATTSLYAGNKDKGKASDKPEEWLPITQQDFAVKEVPNDPGADAIQLYMSYFKDEDAGFIAVYKRIKVLGAGALKPGRGVVDVEIPIVPGETLKELSARTIHPDQSIVAFSGKPFEKVVIKTRGVKVVAESFTLPDVTAGSIIEYRYVITLRRYIVDEISEWPVQQDLFTLKEHLRFRAYQGLVYSPTEWTSVAPTSKVAYSYLNQVDLKVPQKREGNLMELELENVPKFDSEAYMPPEDDYRPTVLFYYGGREMASPEKFWEEWQKLITEYLEKFIGNSQAIHDAAMQAIGAETDPEKKLRKLYARAQQVRNLSFERERTEQERKEEHLKRSSSVQEVLQRGYGSQGEINAVFTAMARAAGFEATMLGVSNRQERSFNKIILSLAQIKNSAVLVKLQEKDLFLSPGTPFAPFGMLRWSSTAASALKFSKGAGFIDTPQPPNSTMNRRALVSLSADGSLGGEIAVEFAGEEALEHRLEAIEQGDAGRRQSLEDEVKSWLPDEAIVKLQSSQGWDAPEQPLLARFTVQIPGFASVTGKRLLAPAFFFPTLQKNMFINDYRHYPIVFPYPFTESDELRLKLPEGYALEAPPYRRKAGLSYAGYEISSTLEDRQLVTKRKLRFDGLQIPASQYGELKEFFAVVQKGDGGQAVFQTGAPASPEASK